MNIISNGNKVEHYRVRYTADNKLTVDDDTYFENLTKLVEVGDVCKVMQSTLIIERVRFSSL